MTDVKQATLTILMMAVCVSTILSNKTVCFLLSNLFKGFRFNVQLDVMLVFPNESFLTEVAEVEIQLNFQIAFCKMLKNG